MNCDHKRAEEIKVGDVLYTKDHGPCVVRSIQHSPVMPKLLFLSDSATLGFWPEHIVTVVIPD